MTLRTVSKNDLPMILSWRNSDVVRRAMYSSHQISLDEHRSWFERMSVDPTSRWYIHQNELGIPDGVVYFTKLDQVFGVGCWGFYLNPDAQKGSGTPLGIDALDEAFFGLNLCKVRAEVLSDNLHSVRFHEKMGFKRDQVLKLAHFNGNMHLDIICFEILENQWIGRRAVLVNMLQNSFYK